MLTSKDLLDFCAECDVFGSPRGDTIVKATALDVGFGQFMTEAFLCRMNFDSFEDFQACYEGFSKGRDGVS